MNKMLSAAALIAWLLGLAAPAWANPVLGKTDGEYHVLDLREFGFESYKIGNRRDSYLQIHDPEGADGQEHWIGGLAADFTVDLLKRGDWGLYWDNSVFGNGTNSQMREVGWNFSLGLQLGPDVQFYWHHLSRHLLDDARDDRYPLDNYFGCRLTMYRRGE